MGKIYFIQQNDNGPIKIGYTNNDIASRLYELQSANPVKLKILGSFPGGPKDEKEIHKKFKKYKLLGEWFSPDEELIEYIGSLPITYDHRELIDYVMKLPKIDSSSNFHLHNTLDKIEKYFILKVLQATNYNCSQSADILHVSVDSLIRRLKKYNIDYKKKK